MKFSVEAILLIQLSGTKNIHAVMMLDIYQITMTLFFCMQKINTVGKGTCYHELMI